MFVRDLTMKTNDFDAVALLSGGLDSVVSVSYITNELKYNNILALFFDYGQNVVRQELEAVKSICKFYNITLKTIKLDFLEDLIDKKQAPCLEESNLDDIDICINTAKSVWVPNRNALFLNIAGSFCDKYGIKDIVIGINKEEGTTFSDNKIEFIELQNKIFEYSTQFHPKIIAPMANYTKEQTLEIEMLLFDLYNLTDKEHKVIGFIAIT